MSIACGGCPASATLPPVKNESIIFVQKKNAMTILEQRYMDVMPSVLRDIAKELEKLNKNIAKLIEQNEKKEEEE